MLKATQSALLWLVSESCETSTSARVILEWLHLQWTSSQPTLNRSPHIWLVRLGMDVAVLCVM